MTSTSVPPTMQVLVCPVACQHAPYVCSLYTVPQARQVFIEIQRTALLRVNDLFSLNDGVLPLMLWRLRFAGFVTYLRSWPPLQVHWHSGILPPLPGSTQTSTSAIRIMQTSLCVDNVFYCINMKLCMQLNYECMCNLIVFTSNNWTDDEW